MSAGGPYRTSGGHACPRCRNPLARDTDHEYSCANGCGVWLSAKLVDDIGTLKDIVEKQLNIEGDSDLVPEEIKDQVEAIYADMVKNDLPGVWAGELDACKDAL